MKSKIIEMLSKSVSDILKQKTISKSSHAMRDIEQYLGRELPIIEKRDASVKKH